MNMLKNFIFIFFLIIGVSCNQKKEGQKISFTHEILPVEVIKPEPFIVKIQDKESSKIMSLSLKYSGANGLKKSLAGQKEAVQNLVISVLSDYDLKQLNTEKGKRRFQKNILTSLNEFIAENKFIKVNLLKIEEI